MRPDEHPELKAMGPGEPTCDMCMYQLFPQASDEDCETCELNPMKNGTSAAEFIRDAANREFSLPMAEVATRHALGNLPKN